MAVRLSSEVLIKSEEPEAPILEISSPPRVVKVNGRDASGVDDQLEVLSGCEVNAGLSLVQCLGTDVSVTVSAFYLAVKK